MRFWLSVCILLTLSEPVFAFSAFTINDIRVEGLTRISTGTVLNYLPASVGDRIDEKRSAEIIRALFKTGFFDDIRLESADDGVLVVIVKERPSIATLELSGNKDIDSEQLLDGLKNIGLAEGRIFNRSALDRVERELERQYFSRGKYSVRVKSTVVPVKNNRVDIHIDINEGKVARIHQINIVGNTVFDEETLLDGMELKASHRIFSDADQYSKQKLAGDLETLRSYYLDHGYINFNIDSTQVSITPDKQDVFITINIEEGELYHVRNVKVAGNLVVPEQELMSLLKISGGDVFSRRAVVESTNAINQRLAQEGYAFANINAAPEIDKDTDQVDITFFVDPGKRVYVRRIDVSGNLKTQDEVVRREFRQMEGGWLSTDKVSRSRIRLQRLGYFDEVGIETPAVPGKDDEVDVNVSLNERPSGTLMAGIGYAETDGLLVNASISQSNFFSTGKSVSATVNNSSVNTVYSFAYTNPYYTLDGVSRGFNLSYRKTDAGQANVADYTADVLGAGVRYGIPLNEFDTASLSFNYEKTRLNTTSFTPQEFLDYIDANGDQFGILKLSLGWTRDTRNRAIFADQGGVLKLTGESSMPGSGLEYYKLDVRALKYFPLGKGFTFQIKGEVAQGGSFGDTTALPFFERYYAGGSSSVRGYRGNSLGPRDSLGSAQGGAFKLTGNAEMIFPLPFVESGKSVRFSAFIDTGNVYTDVDNFDANQLRYSAGLTAIWLTPIAPLTFSYAWPLNAESTDHLERFQFTLGTFFF